MALPDDLERVLCADEEGRARVELAEEEATAALEAARAGRERRRLDAEEAARRELSGEIDRLQREAEEAARERRRRREAWREERTRAAESLVAPGVELWLRIVGGAS